MNNQEMYKQMLKNEIELNGQLVELLEQCFDEMFKDKSRSKKYQLKEDVSFGHEYNGCLQSLDYYKDKI